MELNETQRAALARIRAARTLERETARTLEAEIRAQVTEALGALHRATVEAVRHAHALGVPVRRIGVEGLGTTDYATARRMLDSAQHMPTAEPEIRPATPAERAGAGVLEGEAAYTLHGATVAVRDAFGAWRVPAERRAATAAEAATLEAVAA